MTAETEGSWGAGSGEWTVPRYAPEAIRHARTFLSRLTSVEGEPIGDEILENLISGRKKGLILSANSGYGKSAIKDAVRVILEDEGLDVIEFNLEGTLEEIRAQADIYPTPEEQDLWNAISDINNEHFRSLRDYNIGHPRTRFLVEAGLFGLWAPRYDNKSLFLKEEGWRNYRKVPVPNVGASLLFETGKEYAGIPEEMADFMLLAIVPDKRIAAFAATVRNTVPYMESPEVVDDMDALLGIRVYPPLGMDTTEAGDCMRRSVSWEAPELIMDVADFQLFEAVILWLNSELVLEQRRGEINERMIAWANGSSGKGLSTITDTLTEPEKRQVYRIAAFLKDRMDTSGWNDGKGILVVNPLIELNYVPRFVDPRTTPRIMRPIPKNTPKRKPHP